MAETWKTGETEDSHLKLMGAASKVLDNGEPGPCPLCNGGSVRFYCHRFDKEANRGTIWGLVPKLLWNLGPHFAGPFRENLFQFF